MEILPFVAALAFIALLFALIKQAFFPPRFELDEALSNELELDLRIKKLPDDLARDATRYALVKEFAKQRYTLKPAKPDNKAKAIRNFFRG